MTRLLEIYDKLSHQIFIQPLPGIINFGKMLDMEHTPLNYIAARILILTCRDVFLVVKLLPQRWPSLSRVLQKYLAFCSSAPTSRTNHQTTGLISPKLRSRNVQRTCRRANTLGFKTFKTFKTMHNTKTQTFCYETHS